MALLVDARAHAEIERRKARGQDAAISLHIAPLPRGGRMIAAEWTSPRGRRAQQEVVRLDDALFFVDRRIARYARWRDITVTGYHFGPLAYLGVVNEAEILVNLPGWERSHPGLMATESPGEVPARVIA